MSSIKSSFNYDDIEYVSTVDNKFVDNLYMLILKGNVKKVIEYFKVLTDTKESCSSGETDFSTIHVAPSFIADDFNGDDYLEEEEDDYAELQIEYNNYKLHDIIFSNEYTPLMLASQKGLPELVEYFITLEFDVNKSNKTTGLTALLAACGSSSNGESDSILHFENVTKCVKLLIDADANINQTLKKSNHSALHLVATRNNVSTCKHLVTLMNVNIKNSKGCTPLMLAAASGYSEIVNVLLEAGADRSLRNNRGMSAVELALINNNKHIVDLLVQPTDKLDFFRAWSLVNESVISHENNRDIEESFVKKFYSSKYFYDPVAGMCSSLNLTHLEPVIEKHGVTFSQLLSMSDDDMRNIGISKFSDRKCILNLLQEVHKVSWIHQTSLYSPNYKSSITPLDMLDVIKNTNEHLEFIESTIKYIQSHLEANPSYYINFSQNKSFFEKCINHCQFVIFKTRNINENIVNINTIFDKMYEHALEEDLTSQLNDETETLKQIQLTRKYSNVIKTGVILSGISILAVVLVRSRLINI